MIEDLHTQAIPNPRSVYSNPAIKAYVYESED